MPIQEEPAQEMSAQECQDEEEVILSPASPEQGEKFCEPVQTEEPAQDETQDEAQEA